MMKHWLSACRDFYYRINAGWKVLAAFALLYWLLAALGLHFVPD